MSRNESESGEAAAGSMISHHLVLVDLLVPAAITIFGLAGNVVTIVVLRSPKLAHNSTVFYFTALSAVDILVLLVGPTLKTLSAAVFSSGKHIRDTHSGVCKLQLFLNYSVTQVSAWLLVAVTVDRAAWVVVPFRARQWCTVRTAAAVMLVIAACIVAINARHLWTSGVVLQAGSNRTECSMQDDFTRNTYVTYIDPALVTVGPFLIMLLANLLILRKLREMQRIRVRNLGAKSSSRADTNSHLTKMLLGASAFYLVSSLPYLLLQFVLRDRRQQILQSPTLANAVFCVQIFTYCLFNLNYAIHFLLYCLTGPVFKAEAFRLLRIRARATPDLELQHQQEHQQHLLQQQQR